MAGETVIQYQVGDDSRIGDDELEHHPFREPTNEHLSDMSLEEAKAAIAGSRIHSATTPMTWARLNKAQLTPDLVILQGDQKFWYDNRWSSQSGAACGELGRIVSQPKEIKGILCAKAHVPTKDNDEDEFTIWWPVRSLVTLADFFGIQSKLPYTQRTAQVLRSMPEPATFSDAAQRFAVLEVD